MDDRNVALSEQAMINAPETTDYDENTMVDVEVMSEKPASLSETWHSTSSTTPPSAATAQPVDNYTTGEGDYTSGGVCAAKNTKRPNNSQNSAKNTYNISFSRALSYKISKHPSFSYFHPLITFCWHLLG